jgi:hypothetical protein
VPNAVDAPCGLATRIHPAKSAHSACRSCDFDGFTNARPVNPVETDLSVAPPVLAKSGRKA